MNRDHVMRSVGGSERACRNGDLDAVAELFTEDARPARSAAKARVRTVTTP